ncbi:S-adenosylmethionine tRNA ribosyltransferase [Roseivirga seohaensis subsp. aquiponti]|uniref:S-adenosylmethionine:tRNA ribosyltransferase-isomerase n=2 Tax=Roseivirga seohaensis TaxID=1914963 RepID=A0A0L8AIF8_9BACT|nr:S-adenosylmethionine:tRNA ribosyltransferase-isomerase [Roseivirga seohaensis]KOF02198.1 S-adenosylmethionine tRNA ribosyltransferase [Roseivirga seohaensis subsp. aquiponti]
MMKPEKEINLSDYTYSLPDERIAKYPLAKRDQSKLLHYHNGLIEHKSFKDIEALIPSQSTLFFNNTKVIPARLIFHKSTGAQIEIFLLKPISPSPILSIVMEERETVIWECMIGNVKKWKDDIPLVRQLTIGEKNITLSASIHDRESRQIQFSWSDDSISFSEIVEAYGKVPLPPYLNRQPEEDDKPRYQTVYSAHDGAVAAPTAGLHFTPEILKSLADRGIKESFLTLHVSAGTFQPIKTENILEHPMHSEQMVVDRQSIQSVVEAEGKIIAIGTTSMRTLESLYWFGVRLMNGNENFAIEKLEPYQSPQKASRLEAFSAILKWMDINELNQVIGTTEIFIFPGYQFRVCDGLITNFHQPGSTLILLVAAFIGEDWRKVYQEADTNGYRFLSYGDSSFLLPK